MPLKIQKLLVLRRSFKKARSLRWLGITIPENFCRSGGISGEDLREYSQPLLLQVLYERLNSYPSSQKLLLMSDSSRYGRAEWGDKHKPTERRSGKLILSFLFLVRDQNKMTNVWRTRTSGSDMHRRIFHNSAFESRDLRRIRKFYLFQVEHQRSK